MCGDKGASDRGRSFVIRHSTSPGFFPRSRSVQFRVPLPALAHGRHRQWRSVVLCVDAVKTLRLNLTDATAPRILRNTSIHPRLREGCTV